MDWNAFLEFTRGPLFQAAWLIFIAGMLYRLVRVLMLGWSKDHVPAMGSKFTGIVKSFLKGILIWPFIPWLKGSFIKNPVIYLAGGLFHLGLLVVLLLGAAHVLVWKSLLGFGWYTLPLPVVDWFAAVSIISLVALLIYRLTHPVVKKITGLSEWMNWTLVFLPMLTGYLMTHHVAPRYEVAFSLHMLFVDLLLIWIPFSRISHFMFYFFARTIHGQEFGKRGVNP